MGYTPSLFTRSPSSPTVDITKFTSVFQTILTTLKMVAGIPPRDKGAGCGTARSNLRLATSTARTYLPGTTDPPSPHDQCPELQRNREDFPASLDKLQQLIKDKVQVLQSPFTEEQQGSVCEENTGRGGLWTFALLSKKLTFHLQQLQRQTEQELSNIHTQLLQIEGRQKLLTTELFHLQEKKKRTERELQRNSSLQTSAFQLCVCRELQASVNERLLQSERLLFQEEALSALRNLLSQDLQRYQEETQRLTCFTRKILKQSHRSDPEETSSSRQSDCSMQGKNEPEQENNMESEFDSNKQSDSPSEEEPTTPRAVPTSQNPKYQLYLSNEHRTNGLSGRDADGPGGGGTVGENGPRLTWETNRLGMNHFKGSLESLASRDWDTTPDRWGVVDSPPRVFNSPYATATSMDYNPMYRMSEFKGQGGLSPSTSEMNMYSYNSRSTSPVGMGMGTSTLISSRPRFSAYDTLVKRRAEVNNPVVPTHYSMRSATLGAPNKKDYIEELTKQLDACQKRNQFLEAESVEMEKERNQIRFEMRGLLVNNEDLLRTNTQLTNEMKRMREQMIEMERENQSMGERYREMEIEVKQARDMMVEANTQEYAFNYLQQSLNNKIQDTEANLEKQTQHAKTLSEKLWLVERQLEEMEVDRDTRDKRSSDLNSSIQRLETELAEAQQVSTQATAELSLQQKLREDGQLRVEELEESLLEKEQELQRLQLLVSRLQGEVSGKLIDKEQTLEEEIQLRERIQLQCKQAERMVDDLRMELHSTNQAKDDLAKQVKQAQEKMIDLESDLEELHESEQRWAAKHKRSIEQTEQLQLKLIQEKDLNDQLETEKATMERQLRELRLEVEELHSSRVQEDVISRAESRVKELENTLRTEERNKSVLTNTISKLERRINELSDQMEEEHRIATEQKDLMTQRMRSLKRQLNEAEEETSRREAQYRHTQRELAEERETNSRLQRQLLDQHLQTKRKETLTIRQTLDNLKLDLSIDDEDDDHLTNNVSKV
ncbi:rac guanine nucleotide exchange factor JJ [Perca flavescens]|uniref:rac guanine nucleotide exchange factor JJ n=1 Tax=Perca flavescens TaxID=8167 RepID=UPI00106E5C99|nr:rac guanine nucleotide exchange factor JJ-like [Perca flavescens]